MHKIFNYIIGGDNKNKKKKYFIGKFIFMVKIGGKFMKEKKTIIILILVLFIGIIGLTVAYFSNSTSLDNIFQTKPYGTTVEETFTSPSNWLPGDEITKEITATNTGEVDQAVRIKLTESWIPFNSNSTLNGWIHQDGTKSTHTSNEDLENDERVAVINFDNLSDWTKVGDYYYYKYKLSPNESTSSLIKSVTFNPNTKLDDTCVSTQTATGQTITCNSSGSDYDNATYTLTFDIETVQYNKYNEAWNLNNAVAISETKQRMLKGLKVNVADATFDNGDKTAMFEFSHPATAQTPALTDYRYIGHMPNNYVKFNCDNDGTNCEIWRIIGVFSVDDGEGNYEQRIKLVRGSAFASTLTWDDRNSEYYTGGNLGKNEWNGSKLSIFLNGYYLTRNGDASNYGLKELAQSQIEDAKYYLGGTYSDENIHYGSANDIYVWERGTAVYNQYNAERSISWIGKVALMYPSDYSYVYSKGVENECFADPFLCYIKEATPSDEAISNHPEAGWIYNSNNLEGQDRIIYNWLISPWLQTSNGVFMVSGSGRLEGDGIYGDNNAVRPTVYLKSSIQITGGEGTEQNPYVLSNQ